LLRINRWVEPDRRFDGKGIDNHFGFLFRAQVGIREFPRLHRVEAKLVSHRPSAVFLGKSE
jgi:hypothetical protein